MLRESRHQPVNVTAVVNDEGVRRLLYILWAPTTERLVRAITTTGVLLCLLLMLAAVTTNAAEQAPGTWLWLASAGPAIGPMLAFVLRWNRVRTGRRVFVVFSPQVPSRARRR